MKVEPTSFVCLAFLGRFCDASFDGSRYLWYNTTGYDFNSALPIGNGRLAGIIYGSANEKVSLNENSVWSGPFQDRVNPNAITTYPVVRELLVNGSISEANNLTLAQMVPNVTSPRSYSTTGDLIVETGHDNTTWSNYSRWLDTKQGSAGVSYTYNNFTFT